MKLKSATKCISALAIATWLTFSPLHEARAQEKADSAASKPKQSLLQPINFASLNRQTPNMWLIGGSSQLLYFYKQNPLDRNESTSIYMLSVYSPQWQAGLHRMAKSTPSSLTTIDGAAFRCLLPLEGGSLIAATRLGMSRTEGKNGTQSLPLIDMSVTLQPNGLPLILTGIAGSSEDCIALSAGSSSWMISGLYRHNLSTGISFGAGADCQVTYSSSIGQRFYASIEQWKNSNKKGFVAGSRLFLPFGTLELNYERIFALPAADKQNISLRFTYCLQ